MADLNLGRPGLSVLPLGVGDAFSAIHHPTCLLLSRFHNPAWDNNLVLVDCPQSIRKMMKEADDGRYHGLDLGRVDTLILTHLHADHAGGLETLAAFFKIALGRKLRVLALPEVIDGMGRFLESVSGLGKKEDFFDLIPIDEGSPVTLGLGDSSMYIEVKRTAHSIPTAAIKVYLGDGPVPPKAPAHNEDGSMTMTLGNGTPPLPHFAYSCDTPFDLELWDWLWQDGPSVVMHEVGHGAVHTNIDELFKNLGRGSGDMWQDAEIRQISRLRLIHYPDDMLPFLEATSFELAREGELEVIL